MPPHLRLRLRQPVPLFLLNRPLRYPPPRHLLPLAHLRSMHIQFVPHSKTRPQLMPPVDIRMLLPFLVSEGGNWTLSRDGLAIQRGVEFGTFKETHNFISAVCTHAQHLGHHPEWSNIYKEFFIRLTTYWNSNNGGRGISALDLRFARFCDTHIKKWNSKSNTVFSAGARGEILLMKVGQRKEMAGENGALSSKEFQEWSTKEYINLRKREEDGESGVSVDEPVMMPARETRPSKEASDYEVWTSWKKKTQATYQRRTSWAAVLKEASELGIPRIWASRQLHQIASVYEKENASSSPTPATSAYEKENPSSSPAPVTSSDSTQESHSDQPHPKKLWRVDVPRVIMTKEVIEAQEAWLHTARMETLVYETPIEELHAKAMEQGIDPAWAWEQLASLGDSSEPPKDIPHPNRPTRKTRADREKARAAASIDSPSRDNAVPAAFFPSQPHLSSMLDDVNHRTSEPLFPQKISKKRAKQAKAITALPSSPSLSFPSSSRSPTDDDTETAPPRDLTRLEILHGTKPDSKRFLQKVKRENEQEAKRSRKEERGRLRADMLKATRRAQATSSWEAAPSATLRPQYPPREPTLGLARSSAPRSTHSHGGDTERRPREPTLGLARSSAPRSTHSHGGDIERRPREDPRGAPSSSAPWSTRPHDGDSERRPREPAQRWSKGVPMGDGNVRKKGGPIGGWNVLGKGRRGRKWSARGRSFMGGGRPWPAASWE